MLIPVIAQSHYDVCSALDHISTNDSFAYIKQKCFKLSSWSQFMSDFDKLNIDNY